ncbi:peptide-methionine (S)-S-oxide reductase MsrA [Mycoplasma sp. NEAQ87857]|uniref:peptide-methionine (S)-S-oxide reductase MsrA n=1 Tax=Mycoplasma sp. NEAQ87857 TaxID=2683967 RepID=UPI0013164416|nr:peptide-methionine (S)-S-oxide reductase MsrA [Mycoplasma sp. NEAQ87857]QGZ97684.1 peptide-methionine (S)-S-oxide reductase MsrA [Mycoplasma sp. NEAQ87857]
MRRIYVAGGCFWGVQGYFKTINGIIFSTVGYANSAINNPSYQQVKAHITNAVETVELYYDESKITLVEIINKLFDVIDPTALNYQGPDFGSQYRNGIYYEVDSDLAVIQDTINNLAKNYSKPVVTEIKKLENYFLAEEYHQDYTDKNPNVACHIDF